MKYIVRVYMKGQGNRRVRHDRSYAVLVIFVVGSRFDVLSM
jgi:hypothetical protein